MSWIDMCAKRSVHTRFGGSLPASRPRQLDGSAGGQSASQAAMMCVHLTPSSCPPATSCWASLYQRTSRDVFQSDAAAVSFAVMFFAAATVNVYT